MQAGIPGKAESLKTFLTSALRIHIMDRIGETFSGNWFQGASGQ